MPILQPRKQTVNSIDKIVNNYDFNAKEKQNHVGIFAYSIKTPSISMAKPHRIHIGHLIKEVFDEKGMTVTEFARRINCARPNVYSIFERYDIGVEQLLDISEALGHNFLDDIQLKCGLESQLPTRQLNVQLNLEAFSIEKAEKILNFVNEISEGSFV